jgi:hypothetical protein
MEILSNVDSDVVVGCVERVPVSVFSRGEDETRAERDEIDERR